MHITIVGAGALGRVFGVRLLGQGADVAFVVRKERCCETSPFVIEQANGDRRDVENRPIRVSAVPSHTDVVVVAVRFDQLNLAELSTSLSPVPIVVMTPLLPREQRDLEHALGRRVVPALPGLAAYMDERGVVRYWILTATATLIDDADPEEVKRFIDALRGAGFPTHLAHRVAESNAATTIGFFPLIGAVDAGGGVRAFVDNSALARTAVAAVKECVALAEKHGRSLPGVSVALRFLSPTALKAAVRLVKLVQPEALTFVDAHFGPKLHAQHLAMGRSIIDLAKSDGVAMPALEELMRALDVRR